MTKPYSREEIRDIMNALNLSINWLGGKCNMTRQGIYYILKNSGKGLSYDRNLLLFTYVLNDYIENDLCTTIHEVRNIAEAKKQALKESS